MSLLYADTSALAAAYLDDEPDHAELASLLLDGREAVVTSEIARLELASAVHAASAARRFRQLDELLARIDADLAEGGPIDPIALRADVIFPAAYRLILEHGLRTLDAVHLAVCAEECPSLAVDEDVVFVTRDKVQASAARAMGLAVR